MDEGREFQKDEAENGAQQTTAKKGRAREKKGASSNGSGKRKDRGEAIIVKTDDKSYADVLKTMRCNEKLSSLGGDVNCIRRTRKGEMIVVLKRYAALKSSEYKKLTEEVLEMGFK